MQPVPEWYTPNKLIQIKDGTGDVEPKLLLASHESLVFELSGVSPRRVMATVTIVIDAGRNEPAVDEAGGSLPGRGDGPSSVPVTKRTTSVCRLDRVGLILVSIKSSESLATSWQIIIDTRQIDSTLMMKALLRNHGVYK